jgi:hypothetical protein
MADNLTTFMCRLSRHLEASTSWNPKGLSRPVMGLLYLFHLTALSRSVRSSRFKSDHDLHLWERNLVSHSDGETTQL